MKNTREINCSSANSRISRQIAELGYCKSIFHLGDKDGIKSLHRYYDNKYLLGKDL